MRPTYVRNDRFTGAGRVVGSREHFFHFLIGYLLPIIHSQDQDRSFPFQVLDCGPLMTPILRTTFKRLGYDFRVISSNPPNHRIIVDDWDSPRCPWDATTQEALRHSVHRVSNAWQEDRCEQHDCPRSKNLLLHRSAAHDYYIKGNAEIKGYGLSRRSVTNWIEVQGFLIERNIEHALYEPGRHSLGCQIATFQRAQRIIGMRGAEWANAVWSAPHTKARIFNPTTMRPPKCLDTFFTRLDVEHEFITVNQDHIEADPHACADFFTRA